MLHPPREFFPEIYAVTTPVSSEPRPSYEAWCSVLEVDSIVTTDLHADLAEQTVAYSAEIEAARCAIRRNSPPPIPDIG